MTAVAATIMRRLPDRRKGKSFWIKIPNVVTVEGIEDGSQPLPKVAIDVERWGR